MNRRVIILGALGIGVVLVVGAVVLFRNTTTEVDADDVLARFDAATTPPRRRRQYHRPHHRPHPHRQRPSDPT